MVLDKATAQKMIDAGLAEIASLETEIAGLSGKDNKKARNEKSRQQADIKKAADYIDAERVLADKEPLQEKFQAPKVVEEPKVETPKAAAPGSPKKDDKKKKAAGKEESAGISPAERKELDQCKADVIARKIQLKDEGMSGGQQNKDPEIVKWVLRMNELKAKAGELEDKKEVKKKGKAKGNVEEIEKLKKEIEDYKEKLKTEFGYTKSDINKDEDIMEMSKRLKAMNV